MKRDGAAAPDGMRQLSGLDSLILYQERGNQFYHVASVGLYSPPVGRARGTPRDLVARQISAALPSIPALRSRLVTVPLALDRPYWHEDADADLDFHVRRSVLTGPSGWRSLMDEVGRLHARPLDRTRPLWEAHVIEGEEGVGGLAPGSFALFFKVHHAVADGLAALALNARMHLPEPRVPRARRRPATAKADDASAASLAWSSLGHGASRALAASRLSLDTAGRAAAAAVDALRAKLEGRADAAAPLPSFHPAPTTRFSGAISARRVVEGVDLPLADVARIRRARPGVTINDVLLAVVGGAMRRLLDRASELPEASLAALMPVSLRADGAAGGNEVGGVAVKLRTDVADPAARLDAVVQASREAVREGAVLGLGLPKALAEALPHVASDLFTRLVLMRQFNTTVSNVRGPPPPLFLAGSPLARLYPVSIPADGAGLNHTIVSYDGTLYVGIVSCPEMLPDPARYADDVRASFRELLDAVAPAAPRRAPAPKRSRRSD